MARRSYYNSPYYNPYYNQDRYSITTAGFSPTVVTPLEFQPVEANIGILADSLAKQEARHKEAQERATAVDAALADVEAKLYNSPEMNQWFSDYKNDIKNHINEAVNVGDYAGAINIATQQAGKIASDSSVIGRLEASKNYKAWTDDLKKKRETGYITKDTEAYFLKNTPFKYEDAFDSSGNVVKGDTFDNLISPVKDIELDDFIVKAFKYITPTKPAANNYKTVNSDGTSSQETLEYVSEDDIIRNLNEIFSIQDDARAALWQRYVVQKDKYEELQRYCAEHPEDNDARMRLKQQKETLAKGQGTVDFEHFVARTLGKTAISNNLAYYYKTTANDLESTADRARAGRKGELEAEAEDPDNTSTEGGRTRVTAAPAQGENA